MNPPTTTAKPARSTGRTIALVLGIVLALLSLAPLAGGAALVGVHETERDADGYYATGANALSTPTSALVSDELDVGTDGPDRLFRDGRLATVRVTATGAGDEPVFVGIARTAQVDAYLEGVAHDEITDFELDPFSVTKARHRGAEAPAPPADQPIWAESSRGTGAQTIAWPVQQGDWAVVVMNADGSPGVETDVSVGAKVGFVLSLGIGLLAGGGLLAIGAGALIYFAARTRPRTPSAASSVVAAESAGTS
jgi:hypothetical protein